MVSATFRSSCPRRCIIDNNTQRQPIKPAYFEWSRAIPCYPKDHLKTPKYVCIWRSCKMSYANWVNFWLGLKLFYSHHSRVLISQMCCKPAPIHGCPLNREIALFQRQQEMKRRKGCLPVCNNVPPPPRFIMKQFQCISAKTDCKIQKVKLKPYMPPQPPLCYPRYCCHCPGCCNF